MGGLPAILDSQEPDCVCSATHQDHLPPNTPQIEPCADQILGGVHGFMFPFDVIPDRASSSLLHTYRELSTERIEILDTPYSRFATPELCD